MVIPTTNVVSLHVVTPCSAVHSASDCRILGIFRVGFIFAEFMTSLKSPKIDTAKNKPYYTFSSGVFEIANIGPSENLNTSSERHFRQNFPTRKNSRYSVYGILKGHRVNVHTHLPIVRDYHNVLLLRRKVVHVENNVLDW